MKYTTSHSSTVLFSFLACTTLFVLAIVVPTVHCKKYERAVPCKEKQIYDATILYGFETPDVTKQLVYWDDEYNTFTFRTKAAKILESLYGVTGINPKLTSIQFTPQGCIQGVNCEWMYMLQKVNPEINYFVYALDFQGKFDHNWIGKFPVTNVRMITRTVIAVALKDIPAESTGEFNQKIIAGSGIMTGFYHMMAQDKYGKDFLLDTIQFNITTPLIEDPYGNAAHPVTLHSPIFGYGLARGIKTTKPPNPPYPYAIVWNMATFPASLAQMSSSSGKKDCSNVEW